MPSLAIGLDYFNIEVDNVISQPSTQEIVSQNAWATRPMPAWSCVTR